MLQILFFSIMTEGAGGERGGTTVMTFYNTGLSGFPLLSLLLRVQLRSPHSCLSQEAAGHADESVHGHVVAHPHSTPPASPEKEPT